MTYILSIVLPIFFILFAIWFMKYNYQKVFYNWQKELTIKKVLFYSLPITIKSIVLFILIILIHNHFHEQFWLEMLLFVFAYFIFAIVQSAYSIGGFLSRMKFLFQHTVNLLNKKNPKIDQLTENITEVLKDSIPLIVKITIVFLFLLIFTPNISLFVFGHAIYMVLIASLLLVSLLMNNLIYFGLVSLMIFQFDPITLSFVNVNYIVATLSYIVLLFGIITETRLDNRMFTLKATRMVKDFNFNLGYVTVYDKRHITVYKNKITSYYYIYYRMNGLVIVYESMFDATLSTVVIKKMITKGTQYLKVNGE
jgi:hypothetical protein